MKAELVQRFQYVAGISSDATILYSVLTNSIKNDHLTQKNVLLTHEMFGCSKYAAQEKRRRYQPSIIDMYSQTVKVSRE